VHVRRLEPLAQLRQHRPALHQRLTHLGVPAPMRQELGAEAESGYSVPPGRCQRSGLLI
jgi:hypothetical protein